MSALVWNTLFDTDLDRAAHLSLGVAPDLWASALPVHICIGRVLELLQDVCVLGLARNLNSLVHRTLHALRTAKPSGSEISGTQELQNDI